MYSNFKMFVNRLFDFRIFFLLLYVFTVSTSCKVYAQNKGDTFSVSLQSSVREVELGQEFKVNIFLSEPVTIFSSEQIMIESANIKRLRKLDKNSYSLQLVAADTGKRQVVVYIPAGILESLNGKVNRESSKVLINIKNFQPSSGQSQSVLDSSAVEILTKFEPSKILNSNTQNSSLPQNNYANSPQNQQSQNKNSDNASLLGSVGILSKLLSGFGSSNNFVDSKGQNLNPGSVDNSNNTRFDVGNQVPRSAAVTTPRDTAPEPEVKDKVGPKTEEPVTPEKPATPKDSTTQPSPPKGEPKPGDDGQLSDGPGRFSSNGQIPGNKKEEEKKDEKEKGNESDLFVIKEELKECSKEKKYWCADFRKITLTSYQRDVVSSSDVRVFKIVKKDKEAIMLVPNKMATKLNDKSKCLLFQPDKLSYRTFEHGYDLGCTDNKNPKDDCGAQNIVDLCKKNNINDGDCILNYKNQKLYGKLPMVYKYTDPNYQVEATEGQSCNPVSDSIPWWLRDTGRNVFWDNPWAVFGIRAPTQPNFLPPDVVKRLADPARVPNTSDFARTKIQEVPSTYKKPPRLYNDYE